MPGPPKRGERSGVEHRTAQPLRCLHALRQMIAVYIHICHGVSYQNDKNQSFLGSFHKRVQLSSKIGDSLMRLQQFFSCSIHPGLKMRYPLNFLVNYGQLLPRNIRSSCQVLGLACQRSQLGFNDPLRFSESSAVERQAIQKALKGTLHGPLKQCPILLLPRACLWVEVKTVVLMLTTHQNFKYF